MARIKETLIFPGVIFYKPENGNKGNLKIKSIVVEDFSPPKGSFSKKILIFYKKMP